MNIPVARRRALDAAALREAVGWRGRTVDADAPGVGRATVISRDNGITSARLGLALVVVVSHSFGLTGHQEPLVHETRLFSIGFVAVIGFFALSGWLLAASRERNNVGTFIANRTRRILPGYVVALALGGLVVAGAGGDAMGYVTSNWSIMVPGQPGMPDGSPVNGSLWTLGPELICCAALAVTPVRLLRPLALGWVVALTALWPWSSVGVMLLLAFSVGAAVRLFGIPVTPTRAFAAGMLAISTFALGPVPIILGAYSALGLMHLPLRTSRDLSYGTYVFAYPVQKVLAVEFDTIGVILGTMLIVLPMALLSWTFVESRALRLRHLSPLDRASEGRTGSIKLATRSMRGRRARLR